MSDGRAGWQEADDDAEATVAPVDGDGVVNASRRRRELVSYLVRAGEPVGLTRLARAVAAVESGTDESDVPASHVQTVYLDLHHEHVPALADAGVIEYSPSDGVVELVAPGDAVRT